LNDVSAYQLFVSDMKWEYFGAPNHRILAYCLIQMSKLGIRQPDEDSFQLVVNSFPEEDKDYGGVQYLRDLKNAFLQETDNYKVFLERMKLQALKTRFSSLRSKQLVSISNSTVSTLDEIRELVRDMSSDLEIAGDSGYFFQDMQQLSEQYAANLEERANRKFYTTGFPALDSLLTDGFAPKQISILAGFTGMAKSTVAINMAYRIAVAGTGAAVFSMESTSVSMIDKLVSTLTQIELKKLKKEAATLTVDEKRYIQQAVESIRNFPLLINDQASLSIDGMLFQLQSARRRGYDPKVVFIDLFGKIEDVDTGDNLATRIQKECKRMRVLAKELDMHFCLVVQVGRQGFGRTKGGRIKRPTLIDIKNANAYAEEANTVILLHRNKYYIEDLDDDILEVHVAKQRDGEANVVAYFEMFANTSTLMDTEKRPHDLQAAQ
jgi:replicative DNA helicase